jgi:hypothetical protein
MNLPTITPPTVRLGERLAERPSHGPVDHPGRDPNDKAPHPTALLAGPRRLRVRVVRRERVS